VDVKASLIQAVLLPDGGIFDISDQKFLEIRWYMAEESGKIFKCRKATRYGFQIPNTK